MTDLIQVEAKLTPSQYKALEMYTDGKTEEEICSAIGVRKETLRRWLATNQQFKSMIRQHFSAFATANHVFLASMYEKAIGKLDKLLEEEDLSVKERISVINTVAKFMRNAMEFEKPNTVEEEATITEVTEKDKDGKVMSITEQKTILRRIRGEHGNNEVLDGQGQESAPDSSGAEEVL